METVNQRMKRLRLSAGLSLKQVAARAQIPLTTYREWEYGRAIRGEPYVRIAESLNVSLYFLLTGKKPGSTEIEENLSQMEDICRQLRLQLESLDIN